MITLPTITTKTKLGRVLKTIVDAIRENEVVGSNDFIIEKSVKGTSINLKPSLKMGGESFYHGEYSPNDGYAVGDVVRVMPDTNYVISGSLTAVVTTPGVWMCVSNIPNQAFSEMVKGKAGYTGYIRQDGVNYAPRWPEPTTVATVQAPTGRYWELISTLPIAMTICVDGVNKTYYVDAALSGSTST